MKPPLITNIALGKKVATPAWDFGYAHATAIEVRSRNHKLVPERRACEIGLLVERSACIVGELPSGKRIEETD